jgi:hypothetical protein
VLSIAHIRYRLEEGQADRACMADSPDRLEYRTISLADSHDTAPLTRVWRRLTVPIAENHGMNEATGPHQLRARFSVELPSGDREEPLTAED